MTVPPSAQVTERLLRIDHLSQQKLTFCDCCLFVRGVFLYTLRNVRQIVMSLVSIRLPEDVEIRLAREAERVRRPKSEIARLAIVDYLERMERDRFLGEIARAARSRGDEEVLAAAEEALLLDNEALAIAEAADVREPRSRYRKRNTKKKQR